MRLNEDRLDTLKAEYTRLHAPKKEEKKDKARKLEKVKQQAIIENIEKQQLEKKNRKQRILQLQLIKEEEKMDLQDYNNDEIDM